MGGVVYNNYCSLPPARVHVCGANIDTPSYRSAFNVFTTFALSCYSFYRPEFIDGIESSEFQEWAVQLNAIWRQLGRQVKFGC